MTRIITLIAGALMGGVVGALAVARYGDSLPAFLPSAPEAHAEAAASPAEPKPGARKVRFYRNPMGLPDVSPVPKKDSMGMDYIPVYEDETQDAPGTVRVSLAKVQRAGVQTEAVTRRALVRPVRATGTVALHEARLAVVTARFGGFVEELHVALTGSEVRAGMPLMRVWIESPEILRKQADYLAALRGGRPADAVAAEGNLRLFGIPDAAIDQLRRTGDPVRSILLTAPARGTVMEKPAIVGMRFQPGDMLFKTADLSQLWVMVQVAERDLGALQVGQPARITLKAFPDTAFAGKVGFIYPDLDMATRTARVRIDLPNPDGRIRTGLYADVTIEASAGAAPVLAVPASAIIDSGRRKVAFIAKEDGVFEPRDLVLGARGDGLVEVRQGLSEGERIVVRGNFLIDAESNLRAALTTFDAPPGDKRPAEPSEKTGTEAGR
ncbi:efflux RND transporter periplasmic adaptor subunit [Desertibaculum subflavum]|uniref:efflux RND transporter periplasmic adaptor subunit n=1 Tax=Desertibaculum subflavum TaxID=2268458 RepID=UPI000E663D27